MVLRITPMAMLAGIALLLPPADRAAAGCAPPRAHAPAAGSAAVSAAPTREGDLLLSDGRRLAVAGIALPSRLHPEAALAEAADGAAGRMLAGRVLAEVPAGRDRHGRLAGTGVLAGGPDSDLALALLRAGAGYARAAQDGPDCLAARLAVEDEARRHKRGLWSVPKASVPARDIPALAARTGLFTVVEGRVRAVGVVRDRTYLNFGAKWKQDFTVIVERGDFATIFGHGLDPAMLRGTLVRVRGVIAREGGPAIFAHEAGDVVAVEAVEEAVER